MRPGSGWQSPDNPVSVSAALGPHAQAWAISRPEARPAPASTAKEKSMTIGWLLGLTALLPQPVADQTCLAATVYLEARSEPARGQLAVAEVALRRRDLGRYGDTVCEVVTAPHQFALTTTPKSFQIDNGEAWNTAWRMAGEALHVWSLPRAQRTVVVPHADHFMRLDANAEWAKAPLATIGEHRFYAVD